MRLNLDNPMIFGNELPDDLNDWFTTVTDTFNTMFDNIVADRTANIGGGGAGPISVAVPGMTAESIIIANIQSSSNPVIIQSVTATSTGFDIIFNGDPGASCFVNYTAFLQPWEAQGV